MLRREKLGCLVVFFMPFFAFAALLLWKAGQGLAQGLGRDALAELSRARSFEDLVVSQSLEGCGAFVLFFLGTLLLAGLPVLTIWFRMGRKPEPEPEAELVAPVPGAAPPELSKRSSSGAEAEPGPVGKTGLRIDEWQPGREPVPYLMLESRPRRYDGAERDRATAILLAERLAAALGVITEPPAKVGGEEIYE